MKTKIRGLDLKLHLLSLKYSVLNVTTCTYQIQITVTLLQLVPVHVRVAEGQETWDQYGTWKYMLNETYLASSMFPPASFKTFSPVATSRSTEKKELFLNIHMYVYR